MKLKGKHKKYKLSKDIKGVKIKNMLLPESFSNRSLETQEPKYIVIHEVSLGIGKSPANYGMDHYKELLEKYGTEGRTIGYHYLVSDKEIWQFTPDDEKTHHVGCDFNNYSIGIERLICEGISYCDAIHNQAKLAATLMVKWNIPIDNVISHKTARILCGEEPKQCPNRLIVGQYGGFPLFYKEIKKCIQLNDFFYEILTPDKLENINGLKLEKK